MHEDFGATEGALDHALAGQFEHAATIRALVIRFELRSLFGIKDAILPIDGSGEKLLAYQIPNQS